MFKTKTRDLSNEISQKINERSSTFLRNSLIQNYGIKRNVSNHTTRNNGGVLEDEDEDILESRSSIDLSKLDEENLDKVHGLLNV